MDNRFNSNKPRHCRGGILQIISKLKNNLFVEAFSLSQHYIIFIYQENGLFHRDLFIYNISNQFPDLNHQRKENGNFLLFLKPLGRR